MIPDEFKMIFQKIINDEISYDEFEELLIAEFAKIGTEIGTERSMALIKSWEEKSERK